MSFSYTQLWDSSGSIPSDWNAQSGIAVTSSGPVPISSPNMLVVSEPGPITATWQTIDSATNGNVTVTGTMQSYGGASDGAASVLARGSQSTLNYGVSTFVELQVNWDRGFLLLIDNVGASQTTIGSISGLSLPGDVWLSATLSFSGANVYASLENLSTSEWLQPDGTWTSVQNVVAITTTTTILGSGYHGWSASADGGDNIYADNWSISWSTVPYTLFGGVLRPTTWQPNEMNLQRSFD